jgi:HEAT repeat protein
MVQIAESGINSAVRAADPLVASFDKLRLKSPDPRTRRKGVERLADSSRPSDTELIYASLDDENAQVRCAAVRALARVKTEDALRSLLRALQDKSPAVREAAARALGGTGDVRLMPALAGCLKDPDTAVRIAVAGTLRAMGWRPSTQEELAWFEITLGKMPAPVSFGGASGDAASATLQDAEQDTSFFRRLEAEELRISTQPGRVKELRVSLRTGDLLARVSAVHDLGQVKDPAITQELLPLFRHPDPEMRLAAAQVLSQREDAPPAHFLSLLRDSSPEVRLAAVQFLGRIRHRHITQVLSPLLSDPDSHVRHAAAGAVRQTGSSPRCV